MPYLTDNAIIHHRLLFVNSQIAQNGTDSETWTHALLIKNQLLCQLSYICINKGRPKNRVVHR